MEEKINVAEILKNKPQETKLYDLLYNIDVELDTISTTDTETVVWCTNETDNNTTCHRGYSEFGTVRGCSDGLQILLPSKEMRDWSKFAWKKGDLLINSCGLQCIFKEWASDDYTKFNGCYSNSRDGYEDVSNAETAKFDKLDNNIAYGYVREIERKLGGILNLETLEIEKAQPEFKDGDIVVAEEDNYYDKVIFIAAIKDDIVSKALINVRYEDYEVHYNEYRFGRNRSLRLATDSEKQQLFSALANEGKAWDAEKKQVVDLKPKWTPKPFDKVLVRDDNDTPWKVGLFSHIDNKLFQCVGSIYRQCIPYEGNEHLLGTTKDVED